MQQAHQNKTLKTNNKPTEKKGATAPPARLTERDLLAAMERYGIGTDATVAQHIQNQLDRCV
jgi:DNA topoisomerase IA